MVEPIGYAETMAFLISVAAAFIGGYIFTGTISTIFYAIGVIIFGLVILRSVLAGMADAYE